MAGISVYTFNTNQNVQTHRHSHGHIIITLENEFYFRFFDADHYVSPKEIGFIPPDVEDAHKRRREMSEDMLRRSRFLVICGYVRNEEVEDDIAIARKAKVIVTTLKGVVGCA